MKALLRRRTIHLAALLGALAAIAPAPARSVTLAGGEYGVVVAIDPAMAHDATMVGKIETMMTDASKYLHTALKQQALFGTVTILVPDTWPDDPSYQASEGETVAGADIFVGANVQCGACASPGRIEIAATADFLVGRTVVHEWGHYRFGLGDEYCDYVLKGGSWYQVYRTAAGWNRCTAKQVIERSCDERVASGAPCSITRDETNGATASIMHRQYAAGVEAFCDDGPGENTKHNATVNNHQNRIWGNKSTWAAIEAHADGFRSSGGTPVASKDPVFRVMKAGKPDTVLVIDVSGSMSGTKLANAITAARNFVDRSEVGSALGVVQFSTTATLLLALTAVTDDASRARIKAALPTGTVANTSIGAGMQTALAALQASTSGHKKVMVLLTDGEENTRPMIADVLPSVVAANVRVYAIGLGAGSDARMQDVATRTGGVYYAVPETDAAALNAAFTSVVNLTGSVQRSSVESASQAVAAGATATYTAVLDGSIGRSTLFTFSAPRGAALTITLQTPDGTVLDSTYAGYSVDAAAGVVKFAIDGTAAPGTWTASVHNVRTSSATVVMEVTSANRAGQAAITLSTRLGKASVTYPEPIRIEARLASTEAIVGAGVRAEVVDPSGTTITLPLLDNGQGADRFPLDGVYAAYFTGYTGNGRYAVRVLADNAAGTAEVGSQFRDGGGAQSDVPAGASLVLRRMRSAAAALGEDFRRVDSAGAFELSAFSDVDLMPPSRITTLSSLTSGTTSVDLTWIAPGGDMDTGQAARYELRRSGQPMTSDAEFQAATLVTTPAPRAAGQEEQLTVSGLAEGASYWFAVKAFDAAGNASEMSNMYQAITASPGAGAGSSGCGCGSGATGSAALAVLAALALLQPRRRRRRT